MARIPVLHENDPATPADAKAFLEEAAAVARPTGQYLSRDGQSARDRAGFSRWPTPFIAATRHWPRSTPNWRYLTATVVNNCYY